MPGSKLVEEVCCHQREATAWNVSTDDPVGTALVGVSIDMNSASRCLVCKAILFSMSLSVKQKVSSLPLRDAMLIKIMSAA